jgi:hypothetical protein
MSRAAVPVSIVNDIDNYSYLYKWAIDVRQIPSFFRFETIRCPVFCITRSKGGRSQVTAVPRKTISQKKIPARHGNGLIFKGLLLRSYGRISGHQPERAYQTLKNKTIGNKAHRYRLEKISGTGFSSPAYRKCRLR